MIPFQSIGSPEEGPTNLDHTVGTPPVHVRRRWIVVSTSAWVIGGGLGFALSIAWSMFAYLGGVSGFVSDLANAFLEALDFTLAGFAVGRYRLVFRSVLRNAKGWLLTSVLDGHWRACWRHEPTNVLYASRLTSGDPAELRTYAQIGKLAAIAAGATMVGAFQWLALRRGLPRAGAWIVVSVLRLVPWHRPDAARQHNGQHE